MREQSRSGVLGLEQEGSAREGAEVMDVGVAFRFEAASGHAAAGAALAMKQEGFVFVRGDGFDAVGDFIEGQVLGAGEAAGVEFLG